MKNQTQKIYTKVDKLRFRKTPDTADLKNVIRELRKGQEMELINGPWMRVRIGRTEGWVHGDYVIDKIPGANELRKKESVINFQKGVPNLLNDAITKAVREAIGDEFRLGEMGLCLNCTEYVQYRVKEKLGIVIDWPIKWGRNGGKWASIFRKHNEYQVLNKPQANCAMSFTAGLSTNPKINEIGHVAFVERAYPNGDLYISEANWPRNGIYNERRIPEWKWQKQYKAQFIKFI